MEAAAVPVGVAVAATVAALEGLVAGLMATLALFDLPSPSPGLVVAPASAVWLAAVAVAIGVRLGVDGHVTRRIELDGTVVRDERGAVDLAGATAVEIFVRGPTRVTVKGEAGSLWTVRGLQVDQARTLALDLADALDLEAPPDLAGGRSTGASGLHLRESSDAIALWSPPFRWQGVFVWTMTASPILLFTPTLVALSAWLVAPYYQFVVLSPLAVALFTPIGRWWDLRVEGGDLVVKGGPRVPLDQLAPTRVVEGVAGWSHLHVRSRDGFTIDVVDTSTTALERVQRWLAAATAAAGRAPGSRAASGTSRAARSAAR